MPEPTDHLLSTASRLAITPAWKDPVTGALYVHTDLVQTRAPWDDAEHIGPISEHESFGDVESWTAYVKRYADVAPEHPPFLTWSKSGLHAVLDYHATDGTPRRGLWAAACPFVLAPEWRAWAAFANGQPITQKTAVERLEDRAEDVVEPAATDLAAILRSLRATVNAAAVSELRADGSSSVSFSTEKQIKGAAAEIVLPATFKIAVRVLAGHTDDRGADVRYGFLVRVRPSVDDAAHLTFRFSIPDAERVLETAFASRVAAARALLGDAYALLRAAD